MDNCLNNIDFVHVRIYISAAYFIFINKALPHLTNNCTDSLGVQWLLDVSLSPLESLHPAHSWVSCVFMNVSSFEQFRLHSVSCQDPASYPDLLYSFSTSLQVFCFPLCLDPRCGTAQKSTGLLTDMVFFLTRTHTDWVTGWGVI